MQVMCCHRFLVCDLAISITNNNLSESFFQICNILREAEDCHDFRSNSDIIAVFSRHTIYPSAKSVCAETELTVIHIHTSLPYNFSWINIQVISLIDMVIDHCCQ